MVNNCEPCSIVVNHAQLWVKSSELVVYRLLVKVYGFSGLLINHSQEYSNIETYNQPYSISQTIVKFS